MSHDKDIMWDVGPWEDEPDPNGLTEDEMADLARVATTSPEVLEQQLDYKRLQFALYLKEHGRISEWDDNIRPFPTRDPDDDLPPAA